MLMHGEMDCKDLLDWREDSDYQGVYFVISSNEDTTTASAQKCHSHMQASYLREAPLRVLVRSADPLPKMQLQEPCDFKPWFQCVWL